MAYYSSQASIEAKVKASRVKLWGDKNADGTIDPASLEQAFAFAKSQILARIWQRYGETTTSAWTEITAPDLIKRMSDDLALFYLASGANAVNPVIDAAYKDAIKNLDAIRVFALDLPSIYEESLPFTTETAYSTFDDEEDAPLSVV